MSSIGTYRNAKPNTSIVSTKRDWRAPTSGLPFLQALQADDEAYEQREQQHGHGGGQRPVPVVEELLPQHTPDHQRARAAEQGRNDELADRRNEDQETPGQDPLRGERQRHGQ